MKENYAGVVADIFKRTAFFRRGVTSQFEHSSDRNRRFSGSVPTVNVNFRQSTTISG